MFDNKWQKKEMPLVSLIGMGGGIASPAFLASIVLNILKPTVFSPADDTGVPDFDYTAESSAITNVNQVTLNTPSTSSSVSFNSGDITWANSIYDTENNRVLISYSDGADSGHGKVVIGTINGESIEFGAEHTFANEQVQSVVSAYDPVNHKILVVFREPGSSNHLKYFVGDVDAANDSITWGGRYTLLSSPGWVHDVAFDPDQNRMIVLYSDWGDGYKGKSVVGTINGSSMSMSIDTHQDLAHVSGQITYMRATYIPNIQKFVISYRHSDGNDYGYARVGTVNGSNNTINYGSATQVTSGRILYTQSVCHAASGKVVLFYRDLGGPNGSNPGYARVGTVDVNNNTISFGSPAITSYMSGSVVEPYEFSAIYLPTDEKILYAYQNRNDGNKGYLALGTVDGTSITFGDGIKFTDYSVGQSSGVYDPDQQKVVLIHEQSAGDVGGRAVVYSSTSQVTQLTLTDTTVSKVSDGTLISGTTIDEVLTVGETVQAIGDDPYWIATLGSTDNDYGFGTAVDSSGNIYVTGYTTSQSTGYFDCSIAKYNSSGVIQWQRKLSNSLNDQGRKIAVDSSGNVYIVGNTQTSGKSHILIVKYNTSGTLQWQRTLTDNGVFNYGRGIAVDSSGNVYITGFNQGGNLGSGNDAVIVAKYNTSGTLQWQRLFGGSSQDQAKGVAVDSSGNVYVVGDTVGSNYDMFIAKWNTSGTIQWQRTLGGTGIEYGGGIAVDSSGNAYIIGQTNSHASNVGHDFLIAKYNSSGTIQWQRYIGGASNDTGKGIAVDSSGKIYVTGSCYSAAGVSGLGNNDILIAKYENDGTIEWQRFLGGTGNDYSDSIQVDSSGNVYLAAYSNSSGAGSNDILIAKLPDDGSLTGTYGNYTYTTSSLTAAEPSLTSSTSSLTDSALSFTSSTSSLTESATNLTSSTTTLASASGTVSASSGNTITLSNTTGTWSTGMKVQGVTTDTKDNPDPILAENVSLTSSAPTAERNVNTWGDAVWEIATDENFTQNVQTATTALSATGIQAGPSFTLEPDTGYYTRTKYTALGQESEWSDVTYFVTGQVDFLTDSNANNLYLALPLTNYKSSLTGGPYADVSSQIKGSGSAKVATSTGSTSISSAVASPFTQYTDSLLFGSTTTTSDLFYYSLQLGSNQALTVELWVYPSSSVSNGHSYIQTNNFGGGYYPAWIWGSSYSDTSKLVYFSNPSGNSFSSSSLVLDTWNHVAMCCNGSDNIKMFVNGSKVYDGGYGANAGQGTFTIGPSSWDGIPNAANTRFQDFRIYTGVQKYTQNFTVDMDNPDFGGRILG